MSPKDLQINTAYEYVCGGTNMRVTYIGKSKIHTNAHVFKNIEGIKDTLSDRSVDNYIQPLS